MDKEPMNAKVMMSQILGISDKHSGSNFKNVPRSKGKPSWNECKARKSQQIEDTKWYKEQSRNFTSEKYNNQKLKNWMGSMEVRE